MQQTKTYSHKEILEVLWGLILAMFTAMIASTIVSNALPTIVADLHGSQTGYTWVLVATMLAMTATTPIWGKFADLFSKKMLIQTALVVYIVGSAFAGMAQSMGWLIGARVIQGVGVGGVIALVQIILGTIVSPRERGKYSGYIGAAFGLATLLGPLVGGFIVDSSLGWRGCFYVSMPFAIIAFVVLQLKVNLPVVKRPVKIDYLGSFFIMSGVSVLLIWVSLAGSQFDWISGTSVAMVVGAIVLLAIACFVETTVAEPIIPLRLFKDRTISLATLASIFIGVTMFGATTFLSEYFQTSRGMSPTRAGLMTLCLVLGLMVLGIVSGRFISKTGTWKIWIAAGMAAVVVGVGLLSTIDADTPLWVVGLYMVVMGSGLGATQQNLLLAVQNNVDQANIGAASSVVNFFRTMGGAIGVSALGAILSHHTADKIKDGLPELIGSGQVTPDQAQVLGHGSVPDVSSLPPALAHLFEESFGSATGQIFLYALPCAVLAFIAVAFIKETRLRTTLGGIEEPEINMELAAELEAGAEVGGRR